jgi:hypothetical protein
MLSLLGATIGYNAVDDGALNSSLPACRDPSVWLDGASPPNTYVPTNLG